jgi:GNAT superfamily N-acetyltransferase
VDADAPVLEQLLRAVWGSDELALRYYRFGPASERLLGTWVAVAGGQVVGFGSAWLNAFHPHAVYIGVNVHPAWQRRGIGSRLLSALAGLGDGRLPLQTSTWERSVAGVRFLERHGFVEVRRTWMPELPLADLDLAALAGCEERCLALGYRFAALSDVPGYEELLAPLLAEVYTAAHGINPPRPMGLGGWTDLLRRDPPIAAASFVAFAGDQVVAISLAHEDDAPTLSWSGVTAGHRQHERDLMCAMAVRQVAAAAALGATAMQGEFDSTDPWDMLLMEALPFGPAPAWLTVQRGR